MLFQCLSNAFPVVLLITLHINDLYLYSVGSTATIVVEGPQLSMLQHDAYLLFLSFPFGYICLDTERDEWDNQLVSNCESE